MILPQRESTYPRIPAVIILALLLSSAASRARRRARRCRRGACDRIAARCQPAARWAAAVRPRAESAMHQIRDAHAYRPTICDCGTPRASCARQQVVVDGSRPLRLLWGDDVRQVARMTMAARGRGANRCCPAPLPTHWPTIRERGTRGLVPGNKLAAGPLRWPARRSRRAPSGAYDDAGWGRGANRCPAPLPAARPNPSRRFRPASRPPRGGRAASRPRAEIVPPRGGAARCAGAAASWRTAPGPRGWRGRC